MLKSAVIAAVREEVRAALNPTPTPDSVADDLGYVLGSLPPGEALALAKVLLKPLADLIDASTPAEEPDNETTGAESTGD